MIQERVCRLPHQLIIFNIIDVFLRSWEGPYQTCGPAYFWGRAGKSSTSLLAFRENYPGIRSLALAASTKIQRHLSAIASMWVQYHHRLCSNVIESIRDHGAR